MRWSWESAPEGSNDMRMAHGIFFADGPAVDHVEIAPAPLLPGAPVRMRWNVEVGDGGHARVGVVPPRVAARQTVPPTPRVADGRVRWVEVDVHEQRAVVELPAPWHGTTAVFLYELLDDGTRVPATGGPRTADGLGVLAVVPVQRVPTRVMAARADDPVRVDGALEEPVWQGRGVELVDSLHGEPVTVNSTRVWLAWDDRFLYAAARLEDPDLRTTFTEQDDPLYELVVFELFLAKTAEGRAYLEYEVSARNVTFDARFPRYREGDVNWDSAWRTAVSVDGTIEQSGDRDGGWTVEVAVPWSEICEQTELACPPRPGQRLRANVFRIEHPRKGRPVASALSPTHVPDFHAWDNAAVVELGP